MNKYNFIFSQQNCPTKSTFDRYIAGTLLDKELHHFEKHLIDCAKCSDILEGLLSYGDKKEVEDDLEFIYFNVSNSKKSYFLYIAAACSGLVILFSYIFFIKEKQHADNSRIVSVQYKKLPEVHPGIKSNTMISKNKMQEITSISDTLTRIKIIKKKLNVSVKEDSMDLNEVTVIGYGSQQRTSVTGSVSSVVETEIKQGNPSFKHGSIKAVNELNASLNKIRDYLKNGHLDSALISIHHLELQHPSNEDVQWLKVDILIKNHDIIQAKYLLEELVNSSKNYKKKAKRKLKEIEKTIN